MPLSQPRLTGNLLIQRVRRHANLTTLFRQPQAAPTLGIAQRVPLHLGMALPASLTADVSHDRSAVATNEPTTGMAPTDSALPFMNQTLPLSSAPTAPSATTATAITTAAVAAVPVPSSAPLVTPLSMGVQPPSLVNSPPPAQLRPLPITSAGAATAAVQASLVNPGALPTMPVGAPPVQTPQPGRVQSQPVASGAPGSGSVASGSVSATISPMTGPVTGVVPLPSAKPAAPVQSEEDRTWSRLQAIYRGHKERETRGRAGATPATPPLQRQLTAAATTTAQRPTAAPVDPSAPTPIAPVSQVAATGATSAPTAPGADTAPLLAASPVNQPSGQGVEQQNVQWLAALPAMTEAAVTAEGIQQVDAMLPLTTDNQVSQASDVTLSADAPDLPLEAVWPVQHTYESADPRAVVQLSPTPVDDAAAPMSSGHVAVVREQVRQRLEEVKTGQPTTSKVDVLAPRRPRPVQRMSVVASAPVTSPAGTSPEPAEPATAVQRSEAPLDVSRTGESFAPPMVPTEIGPLPADLWRLIGETPPATAEAMPSPTTSPIVSTAMDNTLADGQVTASANLSGQQTAPVVQAARQVAVTPVDERPPVPMVPPERLQRQMTNEMAPSAVAEPVDGPSASTATTAPVAATPPDPVTAIVYPETPTMTPTTNGESGTQQGNQPVPKATARKNRRPSSASPMTGGAFTTGQTDTDTVARAVGPPSRASADRRVQRQVMDNGVTDTAPEQPLPAEQPAKSAQASTSSTQTAAMLDTDELARQVYSQLKRKLTVERERLR